MKVVNTRKIYKRIMQNLECEQLNYLIAKGVSMPVSMDGIVFDHYAEIKRQADRFQRFMKEEGNDYSEDESFMAVMISAIAIKSLATPVGQTPLPGEILHEITKESRVFHRGCFDENAYLKNIHFDDHKLGRFELTHDSYSRYEVLMYTVPLRKNDGVVIPRIGTFDHEFIFPQIKEEGRTWMSVTPNEILTMEQPIKEAAGNVLVLGCGMGYYAYMVSEKDEVDHVTIVEKEPEVIELFNTFILPQFAHKNKITVVQADAFDYMKTLEDGQFDYCFADIWIGVNDTVPYMMLKKTCEKFRKMKMSYWIEDALIATIIGLISVLIFQEFHRNDSTQSLELMKIPEDWELGIQYLRELLKDVEISKPEQVDYYLDDQNIMNLLGDCK